MIVKMPEGRGSLAAALKLMRAAALAVLLAAPIACKEGPAEEAGEKIDRAAEHAADKIEDAADKLEDKVDDATKP